MKRIIPVILLMMCTVSFLSGQNQTKHLGKWKFEAPNAPEGYNAGFIEVGTAEKGYTASISFGEGDYKLPADKVKIENDVLTFIVNVEGNEVTIVLKPENNTLMKGNATYTDGSTPLVLTRSIPEK